MEAMALISGYCQLMGGYTCLPRNSGICLLEGLGSNVDFMA
jgi:hypothetical protein